MILDSGTCSHSLFLCSFFLCSSPEMHIFFHHETAAKGYAKVVNVICPHAFVCMSVSASAVFVSLVKCDARGRQVFFHHPDPLSTVILFLTGAMSQVPGESVRCQCTCTNRTCTHTYTTGRHKAQLKCSAHFAGWFQEEAGVKGFLREKRKEEEEGWSGIAGRHKCIVNCCCWLCNPRPGMGVREEERIRH